MILYPAIDLFQGKVVRLEKGDYSRMTVYDDNPVSRAKRIRAEGASHLHLVDLEGARSGSTDNLNTIENIVSYTGMFTELGGGIRSMESIRHYLNCGVSRIILGTAAVENEDLLIEAIQEYGEKIAVGVDLLDTYVAVRGWETKSIWTAGAFFQRLTELGVRAVVCTDISRDGMMAGSNQSLYEELNRNYPINLIASGGVSSLKDIIALKDIGTAGVILGKAYYSGAVTIPDALRAAGGEI